MLRVGCTGELHREESSRPPLSALDSIVELHYSLLHITGEEAATGAAQRNSGTATLR